MRFLPTYVLQYADEDLYFFQLPCLKEPTKQDDETKGVSEVCGLGLCAVYFGAFLFPRFYGYIELTILLVPGWHLECLHHLFFKTFRCRKSGIRNTKCVRTINIYIYTYIVVFYRNAWLTRVSAYYISLYLYIYVSMFGCRYHTHKTCRF